ncbi:MULTISPECIES: hypothetical protein [Subtercola]|nr:MULTISPECIES: hypothetical protein [Subtercola]MEA9986562.1 hypothetical protein [Subtercola sp. RTI3]
MTNTTTAWHTPREAPSAAPEGDTATFGAAEVAYAVSLTDGVQRQQAVAFLQIDEAFLTDQIAALGASSLLARGELSIEGDVLIASGAVRLLTAVLQTAVRWTEIALVNDDGTEAALYLQSPALSVFLQPAAMSTWVMVVKDPAAADSAVLAQLIESNRARRPLGTAYLGTETAGSAKNHLFVRAAEGRPAEPQAWQVADVPSNTDPNSFIGDAGDDVGTAELVGRLAEFVRLPGA